MTTLRSQTSGHLPRARHALFESSFVSPVPELHCIASRSQESLRLSEAHARAPVKQTQKYTVTSAIPCAAHPRRSIPVIAHTTPSRARPASQPADWHGPTRPPATRARTRSNRTKL